MSARGDRVWSRCGGALAAEDRPASRGVALIAAVVTLVLLGAVVSGSFFVAARQRRLASAARQMASAFYAAEAGLNAALVEWDPDAAAALAPGAPALVRSAYLSSGDRYEARLSRLNDAPGEGAGYYLLVSTGQAHGPRGGRRRVGMLLRAPDLRRVCCASTVAAGIDVRVRAGGSISGLDWMAAPWIDDPDLCEGAGEGDAPAVLIRDGGRVIREDGAAIEGEPPVREAGAGFDNLVAEARRAFHELMVRSDVDYPGGDALDGVGPAVNGRGACDDSVPENWGEPLVPGHPCFTYTPIIHAAGDLSVAGPGRGQGILLVEGDLEIRDGFEFFGLVVVLGDLSLQDARLHGGALAVLGTVEVGPGGELGLSRCAVRRAVRDAKLVSPHPLAQFSWLEILE